LETSAYVLPISSRVLLSAGLSLETPELSRCFRESLYSAYKVMEGADEYVFYLFDQSCGDGETPFGQ